MARDRRGTASSHGPLMAALNLCMRTSHMGQMRVTKARAQRKAEVSSTDWRASEAAAAAAIAAVSAACAAREAAATWRRQYGPKMYSSRLSSSCGDVHVVGGVRKGGLGAAGGRLVGGEAG